MKNFATIEGRVLAAALKKLLFVPERRNTYPIIGMVEIKVEGSSLHLTCSDLDIEAMCRLDVIDAGGAWAICVNPWVVEKIARLAGSAELVLERRSDEMLGISLDQSLQYDLEGMSPDSFPRLIGERAAVLEAFTNGRLAQLLAKVSWAVSTEETRYYLNGVAWQWRGGVRRFAATDGHRLAVCRYGEATEDVTRIIPSKAAAFLQMLGATITLFAVYEPASAGPKHNPLLLDVQAGNWSVRLKLIDGSPVSPLGYVDIDRVIPKPRDWKAAFTLRQGDLLDALDRALVMDGTKHGGCVTFDAVDGRVTLGSKNPDVGSARVSTWAAWPKDGEAFGVNGRYLRDIVRRCAGDLTLQQIDRGAPLSIVDEDDTMTRVVMPMRV